MLESTRGSHVLDLFLTNEPDLVKSSLVLPGMGDPSAGLCEINLELLKMFDSGSLHVSNYKKANIPEINVVLDAYFVLLETLTEFYFLTELWVLFKRTVMKWQDRFVSVDFDEIRNKSRPWFKNNYES